MRPWGSPVGAGLVDDRDLRGDVGRIQQRPSEPVDAPHHDVVVGFGVFQRPMHPGAWGRGTGAGGDVGEDVAPGGAGLAQHVDLEAVAGDRSVERVRPALVVVGLLKLSFGFALLVGEVSQVLFQRGDLSEPLQSVGFFESFVRVAFDLQQPGHLGW